jgi:probable HAF family extracellular repeat protein
VNANGQVVGAASSPGFTQSHAFSWTAGGGTTDIGTLGGRNSSAAAVNDAGEVVGWAHRVDNSMHAFSWTTANGITDVGTLGGPYSVAAAVNATGQIVGYAATATSQRHAFAWDPDGGVLIDLGPSGSAFSQALDVNAGGDVAGFANSAAGLSHATLFSPPTPYDRVKEVADGLPSTPRPLGDAKARLGEALDLSLWNSTGTALTYPDGMQFFDKVKQAIDRLDKSTDQVAANDEAALFAIAEQLTARVVKQAASTPGASADLVDVAQRQLAAAQERWAVDHSDAFERLKQAWRSAEAALP